MISRQRGHPGLADPNALPIAVAAAQAVAMIGFPEAALTLNHATIAPALSPKSNSATTAIGAAAEDVRKGLAGPVPPHCATRHYKGAAKLGHAWGTWRARPARGHRPATVRFPDALKDPRVLHAEPARAEARYADAVEVDASTPVASAPGRPVWCSEAAESRAVRAGRIGGDPVPRGLTQERRAPSNGVAGSPTTTPHSRDSRWATLARAARMCPDQGKRLPGRLRGPGGFFPGW
ncbi:hypothetical protein LT493_31175 [Streptomyces tricolor]|nr:hypothetical protein [Streptomyces tricolor]